MNRYAIIKSIIDWNPWIEGAFPEKLIGLERDINILQYLNVKEIKILEGSRRVGKSTLMYQVIKNCLDNGKHILYLNFDDEILKKYTLSEIYYTFLEKEKIDYLFIDEVQNCTSWVPFLRKLYDTKELEQIWITGSNSSLIKKEYASVLTGRNITLRISGLNFNEFLRFKGVQFNLDLLSKKKETEIKKNFNEYVKHGSFPELALRDVGKKELLLNYYEDFLYKDIVSRFNVNSMKLKELSNFLHSNSSKLISYRNLSKVLDLNYNSIVDYISYLRDVYLFDMLNKFDFSVKKQLINPKKIYSLDLGISNAISFKFSEDIGRILENLVFIELKKRKHEIYYFKEKIECDFLIKKDLGITSAIQVTHSLDDLDTKKREINGLLEAMKIHNLKEGLILTHDEEGEEIIDEKKIIIKPIWKWLLSKA